MAWQGKANTKVPIKPPSRQKQWTQALNCHNCSSNGCQAQKGGQDCSQHLQQCAEENQQNGNAAEDVEQCHCQAHKSTCQQREQWWRQCWQRWRWHKETLEKVVMHGRLLLVPWLPSHQQQPHKRNVYIPEGRPQDQRQVWQHHGRQQLLATCSSCHRLSKSALNICGKI